MKISSIVDIVNGELLNSPAISFITQAHTVLNKINDGDMYLSSNEDQIKQAISQGAFAIVYDIELDISLLNMEIAFIKVISLEDAITRLLRFYLSNKKIIAFYIDEISYNIFTIYKSYSKNTVFLSNNAKDNFELIYNTNKKSMVMSTNKDFLTKIYPKYKEFKISKYQISNLIVHSLFETSFSVKNKYFHKLRLPLIYIDNFISVLEFLALDSCNTNKLHNLKYMKAIFINRSNQIIQYGKSNRFIIANANANINYLEIAFLQKFYSYGKIKIINSNVINKILQNIKDKDYNVLYITSKNHDELIDILQVLQKNIPKLF
jgi:ferrochelatase